MSKYGLSGFDGKGEPDLAIGSVTGVRWWNLTDDGLTGVHGRWAPGENTAECARFPRRGPHVAPDENCACGFWAYWTTSAAGNPHNFARPVLGVVEGYGKTLIGERGFRCAKARIAALYIPGTGIMPGSEPDWDAPPNLRNKGNAAVATWRALTGRGTCDLPPPGPAETAELLTALEMRLERSYGVPVYATAALMLCKHPPTPDYLPQEGRPASLPGKPMLTVAEARAVLAAKAGHSSEE